MSSYFLLI